MITRIMVISFYPFIWARIYVDEAILTSALKIFGM